MSPRYQTGFGLTDGEVMERLWSFLRQFSKMTKEMRPSHRIDVLTDALLYYGKRSAKNISTYTNFIAWMLKCTTFYQFMHIQNFYCQNE